MDKKNIIQNKKDKSINISSLKKEMTKKKKILSISDRDEKTY